MNFLRKLFRHENSRSYTRYIALGDSISTDDYPGEGKGAAALFFQNQDHLYPDFQNKDVLSIAPSAEFLNLAQDGASTADVLHQQLLRIGPRNADPALITITAGGNDILTLHSSAEEVLFRLQATVTQLQDLLPRAHIILGTIYDPSDGEADLFGTEPMTKELATLLEINDGIRSMQSSGVMIAEIHKHFLGHGVHCKDPSNQYFHPEDPSLWYVLTIEPNSEGAHQVRKLFWRALERLQESPKW